MSTFKDTLAILCTLAVPVLTVVGMFTQVQGGGKKPNEWFPWHPILMALAFPCLMVLGRWSYKADASWGLPDIQSRRLLHRTFMVLAAGVAIVGYLCIFMSHLEMHSFFGYDFANGTWKPWLRILHVYLGYASLILTLAQAMMGFSKKSTLEVEGKRVFTFHGTLGKVIIALGAAAVVAAVWFWSWGPELRVPLTVACVLSFSFAVSPKADPGPTSEETPIVA